MHKDSADIFLSAARIRIRDLEALVHNHSFDVDHLQEIRTDRVVSWVNSLRQIRSLPVAVTQLCQTYGVDRFLDGLKHVALSDPNMRQSCIEISRGMIQTSICSEIDIEA